MMKRIANIFLLVLLSITSQAQQLEYSGARVTKKKVEITQFTERIKADGGNLLPFGDIQAEYDALPKLVKDSAKMTFLPVGFKGSKIYSAFPATKRNIFGYTEQFENAAGWVAGANTFTPNAIANPLDGAITADLVLPNTTSVVHNIAKGVATMPNVPYTLSVYAKAGGYNQISIWNSVGGVSGRFNLSTGLVEAGGTSVITALGNGWYRCSVVINTVTSVGSVRIYIGPDTSTPITGDGVSGVYLWGAQFEKGSSPTVYEPFEAYSDWTFSRGSLATMTGRDGLMRYAPHNLILQSETFDNASWTKDGGSIAANSTTAPDGTTTADKFTENTTAAVTHRLYQPITFELGLYYTVSVYLKYISRQYIQFNTSTWSGARPVFDILNGTVTDASTAISPTIKAVGDGWYRCSATFLCTTAGSKNTPIQGNSASTGTAENYTGSGADAFYIWGATTNLGTTASEYMQTTTSAVYGPRFEYSAKKKYNDVEIGEYDHNLLTYSEQANNTIWATTALSVTTDAAVAPDGTTTADLLTGDGVNTGHRIVQNSVNFTSGLPYTYSTYVKAGTCNYAQIVASSSAFDAANAYADFDIVNGTLGTVGSAATATIQNIGSGWFRISMTTTATITTTTSGIFLYLQSSSTATRAFSSALTTSLYVWGAQLEQKSTAGAYIKTTNAAATLSLLNGNDQNLLLRSEDFTTTWIKDASVSITANQTVAPDGTNTADLVVGNSSSTTTKYVMQTYSALTANLYTASYYFKSAGQQYVQMWYSGDLTQFANFDIINGTVGSKGSSTGETSSIIPVGDGWFKCIHTFTATTANVGVAFSIIPSSSSGRATASSSTSGLYVWGAMLNPSSIAGTYIPTTTTTATATTSKWSGGKYKGLLIEKASTNLASYSQEFDNSIWNKEFATISTNSIIAPDGTLTGDKLNEDNTNNIHDAYWVHSTATSGTAYTFSVFGRIGERTLIKLMYGISANRNGAIFDLSNGTIISTDASFTSTITPAINGWYRCSITFTPTSTITHYAQVSLISTGTTYTYLGTTGSGAYIWGAQLEASAIPTSYIPTTSASVTRSVETCLNTAISGWINDTEGTMWASYSLPNTAAASGYHSLFYIDNTVSDGRHEMAASSNGSGTRVTSSASSTTTYNATGGALNPLGNRVGYAYKANDFGFYSNGVVSGGPTVNTGVITTGLSKAYIGYRISDGSQSDGNIKAVAYFNTRRTNAELQSITQ